MTNKTSILGAAAGLAVFAAVALLPSIVYGGYAGVLLASAIFGAPITATLATRAVIVAGMVLGVGLGAALFAALGATAAVASALLVRALPERRASVGAAR
jgi:hypothetical protein